MNPSKISAKDVKNLAPLWKSLSDKPYRQAFRLSTAKMPRTCCLPVTHQDRHGDWPGKNLGNFAMGHVISASSLILPSSQNYNTTEISPQWVWVNFKNSVLPLYTIHLKLCCVKCSQKLYALWGTQALTARC